MAAKKAKKKKDTKLGKGLAEKARKSIKNRKSRIDKALKKAGA